jgi:acyl dehydratase
MSAVSLNFNSLPSVWMAYPKALLARRPSHVPQGREVPSIEARIEGLETDARHLDEYRRVCGFAADHRLPLTYPHVLAMPLHMAMLTCDAFPVKLLGLVHVRNVVRSRARIAQDDLVDLRCHLAGHRETDRGQEFDLMTECSVDEQPVWNETSTFLARRRRPRDGAPSAPQTAPRTVADEPSGTIRTASWHADANIGRRYASVSGDINPIHIADLTARLFGFDQAIAHGMWSLARTVAELDDGQADAVQVEATFKLPIFLPGWVNLHSWETASGRAFALKDAQGEKPHATGSIARL